MTGTRSIDREQLTDLQARLAVGAPAAELDQLPERVRRAVSLASRVGAPAVPAVEAAVAALEADRERHRAATVATAQARAVMVALALLPVLGLPALGAVLDRPLIGFYVTDAGRSIGAVSAALVAAGLALAHRMTARAFRAGPGARDDEAYDLTAVALTAGLPPGAAIRAAAELLPRSSAGVLRREALALDLGASTDADGPFGPLVAAVDAASAWGAPAAPALRRLAHDLRAEERARVAAASQRLPALLAFPTVVLLLPASLLLVGAPIVASGLEAVAAGA